jgi:hypothetical protein
MSLKYLTDSFLARLRNTLPQNASHYTSAQPWLDKVAAGSKYCRETGVDVVSLPSLIVSGRPEDDGDNSVLLYGALAKLTPNQASEERLWAFLSHVTYLPYMVARWGTSNIGIIEDRFFLKGGGIGSLVRNGIARLWWSGYLTYEPKRSDPFELTRVLFSKQDIHTGLLQRSLGKSPIIRRATLEYLSGNSEKIEKLGSWSRVVQKMMRDLNTAGGVYLLDALVPSQIHKIFDDSLASLAA